MDYLIFIGICTGSVLLLRSWTKSAYYRGMKDGMQISEGVAKGYKIRDLRKIHDRYNRGEGD